MFHSKRILSRSPLETHHWPNGRKTADGMVTFVGVLLLFTWSISNEKKNWWLCEQSNGNRIRQHKGTNPTKNKRNNQQECGARKDQRSGNETLTRKNRRYKRERKNNVATFYIYAHQHFLEIWFCCWHIVKFFVWNMTRKNETSGWRTNRSIATYTPINK